MPTTSNFGWTTPADTDLVKDGAAAIRTLGNGIDTSLVDLKGGTTGQVLAKASNTDLDFNWTTASGIPATIFDAKGDLIAASAADTAARLAVGTNGQYLQADSSTATGLKWVTLTSGGWTQLATGTLSGTQVNISSISADYRELVLYIDGISTNSNNVVFTLRFNNNTSGYMWVGIQRTNTSTSTFGDDRMSEWNLTGATDTLASSNKQGVVVYVPNYANTVTRKQLWSMYSGDNNVANPFQSIRYMWGHWDGGGITPAVDTINLTASGSPFDNGTYYLYGVR